MPGVARQPSEMADYHPEDAVQQSFIKLELVVTAHLLFFVLHFQLSAAISSFRPANVKVVFSMLT